MICLRSWRFAETRLIGASCKSLKRKRKLHQHSSMRHLADSVAAEGFLSPRRCRDVCLEERKRQAKLGMILRREFYIECTCGYRGPAKSGGCRQCGTKRLSPEIEMEYPLLG